MAHRNIASASHSPYPDPELSYVQNTWTAKPSHGDSFNQSASSRQNGESSNSNTRAQLMDTSMTGTDDAEEEDDARYDGVLPGDDDDDFLDGYESDPDYLDFQNNLRKLRNQVLQLRADNASDDEDRDLGNLLGSRKKGGRLPKGSRPRGRQPGVRGPRKAAELTGDIKMRLGNAHEALLEKRFYDTATLCIEVIRLNAEVPLAWDLLSNCFIEAGRDEVALTCKIYAAEMSPRAVHTWIRAAEFALSIQTGNLRSFLVQAHYCYGGGIRADPKNLDCRYGKAHTLEQLGNIRSAISEYEKILSKKPWDTDCLGRIAELCIDHGRPETAIAVYKTAIAHYRKLPIEEAGAFDWNQVDTYITLQECMKHYYDAAKALKSLSRWLLLRGDETFWDEITGSDCEWDADDSRRAGVSGYIPGKHPSERYRLPIEFRAKLGLYRLHVGQYHEAMHHFKYLDPGDKTGEGKVSDYAHLYLQIGDLLLEMNLYKDALQFYTPLKDLDEYREASLLTKIGRCLLHLEDAKSAEQTFRDAIELDDAEVGARMELARIHEGRKETQKAFEFVNEVMLLRREQHQEAVRARLPLLAPRPPDMRLNPEEPVKKRGRKPGPRKPIRVKRPYQPRHTLAETIEREIYDGVPQRQARITAKAIELKKAYQTMQDERDMMRAGDADSTEAWLEAARALTDDFRSCKAFYPWDKYVKFLGYHGETRFHAATALDADVEAMADRLSKELGADAAQNKMPPSGKIPTEYRSLSFQEWLDIFLEFALCLARNNRPVEAYDICNSLLDSTIYYHNREDMFLTHLCWCLCALLASDEEVCVAKARYFMVTYQFTTDSYRLFGALARAIQSPVSWYSSGPSQKYILRQIKCMDLALVDEEFRGKMSSEKGTYSVFAEDGSAIENKDMDICLIMLYGHILFTGQSYAFALNYFYRAHALDPENPLINLCIGLCYIHHGLKRQCENRQHNIMQGITFMFVYYDSRKLSPNLEERQEAHYNMARIYHLLGLTHLALPFYRKVLDELEVRDERGNMSSMAARSKREDLVMDTAYNLQSAYAAAGNMEAAREITRRWLVL